jgi:hypothetical protein
MSLSPCFFDNAIFKVSSYVIRIKKILLETILWISCDLSCHPNKSYKKPSFSGDKLASICGILIFVTVSGPGSCCYGKTKTAKLYQE